MKHPQKGEDVAAAQMSLSRGIKSNKEAGGNVAMSNSNLIQRVRPDMTEQEGECSSQTNLAE
eukprot:12432624-Ditylum_brightwellii.AAC.1